MSERPCPIRGGAEAQRVAKYSTEEWTLQSCGDCSLVYLANPPGYSALVHDFAWEKTYADEDRERLQRRPVLHRADRYRAWFGGGNLLNVGCGEAAELIDGFTMYGIEVSEGLATKADAVLRAQGGHCVHAPAVEGMQAFAPSMFDGIVMRSYLEHEEHPLTVLQHARRVIRDTGKIYVRVPNFACLGRAISQKNWPGFRYPDHVNYFTLDTLRDLARRAGFDVKLLNPIRLPVDDNINCLFIPRSPQP